MESIFARSMMILPSQADSSGCLGVPDCFALFMDLASEHAEALAIGTQLTETKGLFWLTVRTRIQLRRRPRIGEYVTAFTWPEPPEGRRANRQYLLATGKETLAVGRTEWALMNVRTGKLESVASVYPKVLELSAERACDAPFTRVEEPFTGSAFARHTVRATDIDLGGHMNNTAYVRAIADAFSTREWNDLNPRDIEIVFLSPCREGDVLHFQKRLAGPALELRGSVDDRTTVLARIQ